MQKAGFKIVKIFLGVISILKKKNSFVLEIKHIFWIHILIFLKYIFWFFFEYILWFVLLFAGNSVSNQTIFIAEKVNIVKFRHYSAISKPISEIQKGIWSSVYMLSCTHRDRNRFWYNLGFQKAKTESFETAQQSSKSDWFLHGKWSSVSHDEFCLEKSGFAYPIFQRGNIQDYI